MTIFYVASHVLASLAIVIGSADSADKAEIYQELNLMLT